MYRFFPQATRHSLMLAWFLLLVHALVSWSIIFRLATTEPDAQWQLIWVFFLPIDFPFSLLVYYSSAFIPDGLIAGLRYPISDIRGFIWPSIIHGILGPIWYFFIPLVISNFINGRKQKKY